jgi:hypothetical protein
MEINLKKKEHKTTFKNPFEVGDHVRVEIPGLQKKSEGKYSNEIYTITDVRGKRVLLNDGKMRKYDMLLKVSHVPEVKKPDVIKRAKQEYKQEQELKVIDNKGKAPEREKRGNRGPAKRFADEDFSKPKK